MPTTHPNQRLERIAQFVQRRLQDVAAQRLEQGFYPRYRWEHTLRVSQYGRLLAEGEGAQVELVVAACLLHDVASFDPGERREHGRLGAQISRPFLVELGYPPAQVENICYSIASHVDVEKPETLEAKIVTDADNIDRFGAYRILLWCMDDLGDFEKLTASVAERLQTLEGYRRRELMETRAGQELFNQQLDLQIAFYKAVGREKSLTNLPSLNL